MLCHRTFWKRHTRRLSKSAVFASLLVRRAVMLQDANETLKICNYLATHLQYNVEGVRRTYSSASRNVCTVLRRQILNTVKPTSDHPLCGFLGEEQLLE